MKVPSDAAALELMNDSPYGLTASVWTNAAGNEESARVVGWFVDELECGTVFLNRWVDYLLLIFISLWWASGGLGGGTWLWRRR